MSTENGITRRSLLAGASAASLVGLVGCASDQAKAATPLAAAPTSQPNGSEARQYWVGLAEKISSPVLMNLAARTLKKNMPVEERPNAKRGPYTHLEAFGRLLAGIAPWLETDQPTKWVDLARESLDAATDPKSPDYLEYKKPAQPLVDAAYLAAALLRAPKTLWEPLSDKVKSNVIEALKLTRGIKPGNNNWVLFASMVEAALFRFGKVEIVRERVQTALDKHAAWYVGDGTYGDGERFHWDYYNSFVIQPFLIHTLEAFPEEAAWQEMYKPVIARAARYASVQERMISPEGAYPPIGRSIAYRFGAFHLLGLIALRKQLAKDIKPAAVRCAMTAMIKRQMESKGNFDANGWLTLGFAGHQPRIADSYVSTGSLYLCANGLVPLGLPASDPFWSDPDAKWSSVRAYAGEDMPVDHSHD